MTPERDWFDEAVKVMARLRAPGGCPWDREQTHASLKHSLLEEAAEAIDAIEAEDAAALRDELGDVLLQVLFHAQIAAERGDFNAQDVAAGLCRKLIRRHPHVFGEAQADSAAAVVDQWERIKTAERADQGQTPRGALDGVPRSLPALHRAYKVQKKAARVGFDWPTVAGVIDKVREELDEVGEALAAGDPEAVAEEVGDLLFAATNLSRFVGRVPEDALHETVGKFERRFRHMEARLAEQGRGPADCSLDELEALWQRAKAAEKKAANSPPDSADKSSEGG